MKCPGLKERHDDGRDACDECIAKWQREGPVVPFVLDPALFPVCPTCKRPTE